MFLMLNKKFFTNLTVVNIFIECLSIYVWSIPLLLFWSEYLTQALTGFDTG